MQEPFDTPILITRERAAAEYRESFVGIDVGKPKNAIAIAEADRKGEIRLVTVTLGRSLSDTIRA